ncbi:hypothetical protein [Sagittula sp. S175]|uniref:hypothetical protein n=1 Tax=Sagittula sp. S175 TaxID=3415129 RepID=UPI003C7CA6D0
MGSVDLPVRTGAGTDGEIFAPSASTVQGTSVHIPNVSERGSHFPLEIEGALPFAQLPSVTRPMTQPHALLSKYVDALSAHDLGDLSRVYAQSHDAVADPVPAICDTLLKTRSPDVLAGLLVLLLELDKDEFHTQASRLLQRSEDGATRRIVELLSLGAQDTPDAILAAHTALYVSPAIPTRKDVIAAMVRWSQTPGVRLDQLARIDILSRVGKHDLLGKYDAAQQRILLTISPGKFLSSVAWRERLLTEFTFYHEVGHHLE